jgi:formylglycine-generating enzyme required for sulfatase activity/TolB-like protein
MNAAQAITNSILKELDKLKKKTIAVIEFSELRGQEYVHSASGRLLAERLTTGLVKSGQVEVVERSQLEKVKNELKLESSGMVDDATAKSIGRILGVEAIVTGTMTRTGSDIEIHSRLIRVEDGRIMTAVSAHEPLATYEDLSVRDSREALKQAEEELKRLEELQAAVREQQKLKALQQQIEEKKKAIAEERLRLEQSEPQGSANQGFGKVLDVTELVGNDGAPMVLVPAGEFFMGANASYPHEADGPKHPIYVDVFYIDKFEVTTGRYAQFLKSTRREPPKYWDQVIPVSDGERPVIGVSWDDADAYCRWAGKRLPAEAEWERTARGYDERLQPWGDEKATRSHANFGWFMSMSTGGYKELAPVGGYRSDRSPYGVYDLGGNVAEWVADWFDPHYYSYGPKSNPKGPGGGREKVIRGGSYWNPIFNSFEPSYAPAPIVLYKDLASRGAKDSSFRHDAIGFRCARNVR